MWRQLSEEDGELTQSHCRAKFYLGPGDAERREGCRYLGQKTAELYNELNMTLGFSEPLGHPRGTGIYLELLVAMLLGEPGAFCWSSLILAASRSAEKGLLRRTAPPPILAFSNTDASV
jgi:hypothetical protein